MTVNADTLINDVESEYERLHDADYYTILGVPQNALEELVRGRFREMARVYHADRYTSLNLPPETKAKMTQILGWISRAHSTLTDPVKRQEYDATLALKEAGIPSDLESILEAEALFRSGKNLLDKGLNGAALSKLDAAAEKNPAEPEYAATAAYVKYWCLERDRKGRVKDRRMVTLIVEHLADFFAANPRKDDIGAYLGMIAKAEGDPDRALEYFQEAFAINSNNMLATRELRLHNMRRERSGGGSFIQKLFGRKK